MRPLCFASLMALAAPVASQPVDPDNCGQCAGSDFLDQCLIQSWEASHNGPAAWMRARGIPFTITGESAYIITFHPDGEFVMEPYTYTYSVSASGHTATGDGETTGGRGCWSTVSPNTLNLCHVGDGPKISVTVRMPTGQIINNNNSMFQKSTSAWRYFCEESGGLTLDIATSPSMGAMSVRMHRRPPP
ncbi:hypothetical protein [Ruegeria hyattellae]|uniref:hypothetical protein n=1 Tax=Ruegeria hyattellae TaxID=3233337 RepID=UPI00355BF1C7